MELSISFKKYGSLDTLEYSTPDLAGAAKDSCGNIILLHGYGANAEDLYPIAKVMNIPGTRWIFPDGTEKDVFGMGRAWFPLSPERLQRLQSGMAMDNTGGDDSRVDLDAPIPQQLVDLRGKINQMMKLMHLDPSKTIIGGFSQGSMAALDCAVNIKSTFAGALLWSSSLVGDEKFWQKVSSEKPYKFFQTHGKQDQVLPYKRANALYDKLKESNWSGDFHSFNGGHEIPMSVLEKSRAFISECFK